MSPEIEACVSSTRSKYAFLFSCVAELYRLHYGERPSKRFSDIRDAFARMSGDGVLSEFLQLNGEKALDGYQSLSEDKLKIAIAACPEKEAERIARLDSLVDLVVGDVCSEIAELEEAEGKAAMDSFLKARGIH